MFMFKSISDFIKHVPDTQSAISFITEYKINIQGGIFCPFCGSDKPYKTTRGYKCRSKECYKKFSLINSGKVKNTKIPLEKWLLYLYMWSNNNKVQSSVQFAKNLGISQNSAWYAGMTVRSCFVQEDLVFHGTVEIDEAFVSRYKKWGALSNRKGPIIGLYERESKRVIIKQIPDRKIATVLEVINKHVAKNATIYTDAAPFYIPLIKNGYLHDYVFHNKREWVNGDVHTNNIEGVWGYLKNNIRSAHHYISDDHIQKYCDEVAFKINNRELNTEQLFTHLLNRIFL